MKRTKAEIEADPEQEDEFGYTNSKCSFFTRFKLIGMFCIFFYLFSWSSMNSVSSTEFRNSRNSVLRISVICGEIL